MHVTVPEYASVGQYIEVGHSNSDVPSSGCTNKQKSIEQKSLNSKNIEMKLKVKKLIE